MRDEPKMLQWHPAFYAGIQIELEQEAGLLEFQNEYQLGTKPKEIDVLIIHKDTSIPLKKNIARIFRKHNIIEYKGPTDYLSIDDFYTGYGYACFYKASTIHVNQIRIEEVTLTFASTRYPRSLIRHLNRTENYEVIKEDEGIYYVTGALIPIQLIITSKLDPKDNIWLRSLTNKQIDENQAEQLVREYGVHKNNKLYQSVMDVIVRANRKQFVEVKNMCDALMEIMKDELDEREARGETRGEVRGQELFANLTKCLIEENKIEELKRAAADIEFRNQMFLQYKINRK